jgi:hypothetical protein
MEMIFTQFPHSMLRVQNEGSRAKGLVFVRDVDLKKV